MMPRRIYTGAKQSPDRRNLASNSEFDEGTQQFAGAGAESRAARG